MNPLKNGGAHHHKGGKTMAVYSPLKSSLVMRLDAGNDLDGKMIVRSVTMSRVRPAVTADALQATFDAIEPLFAYPVIAVEKVGTDLVEAE